MNKTPVAIDSKEALMDDLYRARAALVEFRAMVKAKKIRPMELFDAELEFHVNVAERGLARVGKKK
jgi:hypothetical protein